MKQTRKRLLALIMALAMCLSLCAPAWAAEESTPDTSVESVSEVSAEAADNHVEPEPETESSEGEESVADEGHQKESTQSEKDSQAETADVQKDGTIDVQDDDDDEYANVTYENGDWRLPSDAGEMYLLCARDVIAGHSSPDHDFHFEMYGIAADYIYNGDGTFTLKTSGKLADNAPKSLKKSNGSDINLADKYGFYMGDRLDDEFYSLNSAVTHGYTLDAERQARYTEMKTFIDAVYQYAKGFVVTKVVCDSTYDGTFAYFPKYVSFAETDSYKGVNKTYKDCAFLLAPISNVSYYNKAPALKNTVVEIELGSHVRAVPEGFGEYYNQLSHVDLGCVEEILDDAFCFCDKLVKATIPATVKQIGYQKWDSRYPTYSGPVGACFSNVKELVFEGDIIIGAPSICSYVDGIGNVPLDKITAYGNVTLHGGSNIAAKEIDFKKDFITTPIPGIEKSSYLKSNMGSALSLLMGNSIRIGGNADLKSCCVSKVDSAYMPDDYDWDKADDPTLEIGGNVYFHGKNKNDCIAQSSAEVKSLVVGGDLDVHEAKFSVFSKGLKSVSVGGTIKQNKSTWADTPFENYPVKSHGTTTASEVKTKAAPTPKITSVKSSKKRTMTIKWKKVSGKGYVIQYSPDSDFRKKVKTITVKDPKKTSLTVKKLKSKEDYYVRMYAIGKKKGTGSPWAYGPNGFAWTTVK